MGYDHFPPTQNHSSWFGGGIVLVCQPIKHIEVLFGHPANALYEFQYAQNICQSK